MSKPIREPSVEEMVEGLKGSFKLVKDGVHPQSMERFINLDGDLDLTVTFFTHPHPNIPHQRFIQAFKFVRVFKNDLVKLIKTQYPIMGSGSIAAMIDTVQEIIPGHNGRFYAARDAIYVVGDKQMCMFFMDSASNRGAEMKSDIAAAMVTH